MAIILCKEEALTLRSVVPDEKIVRLKKIRDYRMINTHDKVERNVLIINETEDNRLNKNRVVHLGISDNATI